MSSKNPDAQHRRDKSSPPPVAANSHPSAVAGGGSSLFEWPLVREWALIGQYTDPATGTTHDVHGYNLRAWCPLTDAPEARHG